jgi:hypothetical protein
VPPAGWQPSRGARPEANSPPSSGTPPQHAGTSSADVSGPTAPRTTGAPSEGPPIGAAPTAASQAGGRVDRGPIAGGVIVIGIGLFLLFAQVVPDAGQWIPLIIGLVFLGAFAARREYGFLVAGSIIAGVGTGIVLASSTAGTLAGAMIMLSIAGGFLAIWLIGTLMRLPESHWWPFIPGGILAFIGVIQLSDAGILRWWPLVLVALGALIIANTLRRTQRQA